MRKSHLFYFIVFSLVWLFLSFQFNFFFIFCCVVSSIITIYICLKLNIITKDILKFRFTQLKYLFWLLWEIFKSSFSLSLNVLFARDTNIRESVKPVRINIQNIDEMKLAIYANSITLTPGTITIDIKDNNFLIHSIDRNLIQDLEGGKMLRWVVKNV